MKPSTSEFHSIRGLRYHVRTWGNARDPRLFLLHGWMDVSASFQFLVDCLQREWHVVAPDWRGFGLSGWAPAGYWFPDYYAAIINAMYPQYFLHYMIWNVRDLIMNCNSSIMSFFDKHLRMFLIDSNSNFMKLAF